MNLIYKYTSPSGKFYIGKTKESREARRKYEHNYAASKGNTTAFHCAIRKYGIDAFVYEVLMSGIPDEIVDGIEIIHINLQSPAYNHTGGGDGVDSVTARRVAEERWADPVDAANRISAMKGKKKTVSEAFKKAQSARCAGKPNKWNTIKYTCPHCNKEGRGPNMKRYHFNKCKDFGGGAFEGLMDKRKK